MVNVERVQLFTAGLRSGDYPQGPGCLARADVSGKISFCCLGVATEVAIANGLQMKRWSPTTPNKPLAYHTHELDDPAAWDLHEAVRKWYGFESPDPELVFPGGPGIPEDGRFRQSAAEANDSGRSFAEIADAFDNKYVLGVDTNPEGVS